MERRSCWESRIRCLGLCGGSDGSGWFSGDSGWAGVFVGEESFVSRGFVAVSGERVVVVSGDVLGCGSEGGRVRAGAVCWSG